MCIGGAAQSEPCTCGPGYYSNAAATGACANTTGSCVACPAGFSCAGNSAAPVACACAAGTASSSSASASCDAKCLACGPGAACVGGSAQAVVCNCTAGYYSASPTSSGCTAERDTCRACDAGWTCGGGGGQPAPCPVGHFCPAASSSPIQCPGGAYGASTRLPTAACSGACPRGSACRAGATAPSLCAAGTVSATEAALVCDECVPGMYQPRLGQPACVPCPLSSYVSAFGASACLPCVSPSIAPRGEGAVACVLPPQLAMVPNLACSIQRGSEVACWGAALATPTVLVAHSAAALSGRAFITGATGVCVGAGYVAVVANRTLMLAAAVPAGSVPRSGLLVDAVPIAVTDSMANASVLVVHCAGPQLCAMLSSGGWKCGTVTTAIDAGRVGGAAARWTEAGAAAEFLTGDGVRVLHVAVLDGGACVLRLNGTVTCAARQSNYVGPMLSLTARGNWTCGVAARTWNISCWHAVSPVVREISLSAQRRPSSVCLVDDATACALLEPEAGRRGGGGGTGGTISCWQWAQPLAPLPHLALEGAYDSIACSAEGVCGVESGSGLLKCVGANLTTPACPLYSAGVPNSCAGVLATAIDTGGRSGISTGDVVEVSFSRTSGNCSDGAVIPRSAGGAVFGADVGATDAVWAAGARALRLYLGDVSRVSVDATRIGALVVNISGNPCVGQLNFTRAVDVQGSWGPRDPPHLVRAWASESNASRIPGPSVGDTIALSFDSDTNRAVLRAGDIDLAPGLVMAWVWLDHRTCVGTLIDAAGIPDPRVVRIGVLTARVLRAAALLSSDFSSGPCNTSSPVAGSWGNAVVNVQPRELSTAGGGPLLVVLAAPLGAGASAIPVSVALVAQGVPVTTTFQCLTCAFREPAGDAVVCTAPIGVGSGLLPRIEALGLPGVTGARAVATFSYASPVISGVSPKELPTSGGLVVITGREFGPAALNAVAGVQFYHGAVLGVAPPGDVFGATGCYVNVSHTAVVCNLLEARGAALRIALRIADQATRSAALTTRAPTISSIALVAAGECMPSLCTRGGDTIRIEGENFGPTSTAARIAIGHPSAAAAVVVKCVADREGTPAPTFVMRDCAVVVAHTVLLCTTPPGYGAYLRWQVAVLDNISPSTFVSQQLAYAGPAITSVVGAGDTASSVRTIAARNVPVEFADVVRVAIDGVRAIPISHVRNATTGDDELRVVTPAGVGRASRVLTLSVGSQSVAYSFGYDPPSVVACGLAGVIAAAASAAGGSEGYRMAISGANLYGGGGTASSVSVLVGTSPCEVVSWSPTLLECVTSASVGIAMVTVSDQRSVATQASLCNASAALARPTIGSVGDGAGGLQMAGGAVLSITGSGVTPFELIQLTAVRAHVSDAWNIARPHAPHALTPKIYRHDCRVDRECVRKCNSAYSSDTIACHRMNVYPTVHRKWLRTKQGHVRHCRVNFKCVCNRRSPNIANTIYNRGAAYA